MRPLKIVLLTLLVTFLAVEVLALSGAIVFAVRAG